MATDRPTRPGSGQPVPTGIMTRFVITDREFDLFRELIHKTTGIALSDHKKELVVSRLAKRLRSLHLASFMDYYQYLTQNPAGQDEMNQMVNRITTNKTDFFREAHHFAYLGQVLLPELLAEGEKTGQRKIRAWSAACSTGEEPYTMAITIADFFSQRPGWDVKILATDLDTEVLAFASRAVYPEERVAPVPRNLLGKYFTKVPGHHPPSYQVAEELRKMVIFRRFNLMQETFPIKVPLDLIFCRNVMIYFDMPDKISLLKKFHTLLKPGAPIFVGHSESLMMVKDLFRYVQSTIYKKI